MSSARIALYDLSGSYDAVVNKVKDGLAPLYQKQDGFESFFSVEGNKKNSLVSVSTWNNEQSATQGATVVQEWVRNNISEQVKLRDTVIGEITKY
jgi:heme-degrading monooxygenase HmoA